jgi:hypothetical protein
MVLAINKGMRRLNIGKGFINSLNNKLPLEASLPRGYILVGLALD